MKKNAYPIILVAITLVVLAWTGLVPLKSQRAAAYDSGLADDLSQLRTKIEDYSGLKLPASLGDLSLDTSFKKRLDKSGIEYNIKSTYAYELCASFKTDTKGDAKVAPSAYPLSAFSTGSSASSLSDSSSSLYGGYAYADFTVHPKGHHCFTLQNYGAYRYMDGATTPSSTTKPTTTLGI